MLPKYSDTTVNGKNIRIKLLPALTVGIPTARRLLNIIAPAVGGTLDGLRHDDFIHGAPKTFSEMALVVCKQLEEAEVHQIMFTLIILTYHLKRMYRSMLIIGIHIQNY